MSCGNIWTNCAEGAHIYDPSSNLLGKIIIESYSATSNLAFGKDSNGSKWFYTASNNRILRVAVNVQDASTKFLSSTTNSTASTASHSVSTAASFTVLSLSSKTTSSV